MWVLPARPGGSVGCVSPKWLSVNAFILRLFLKQSTGEEELERMTKGGDEKRVLSQW